MQSSSQIVTTNTQLFMANINKYAYIHTRTRGRSEELRKLLGLELVSLMIKKSRLRWFGHAEQKDDWVKHCIMWEVEGIRHRGCPQKDLVGLC